MPATRRKIVECSLEDGRGTFGRIVPQAAIRAASAVMRGEQSRIVFGSEGAPVEILNRQVSESFGAIPATVLMHDHGADVFGLGWKPHVERRFHRQLARFI
jgi:hypothetical protein